MKRARLFLSLIAIVALTATAAQAGEQCTASAQECLNKLTSHYQSSGWAGLEGDWSEEDGTWTVTKIVSHSPAEMAGVQKGDVFFGVNGMKFAGMTDEQRMEVKAAKMAGNTVTYMAKRDGYKKEIEITLAEMPEDAMAKNIGAHMIHHADVASVQ